MEKDNLLHDTWCQILWAYYDDELDKYEEEFVLSQLERAGAVDLAHPDAVDKIVKLPFTEKQLSFIHKTVEKHNDRVYTRNLMSRDD